MKAAIFDMDGTILDSMGMWRGIFKGFLKEYRIPFSEKLRRETKDMGLEPLSKYLAREYPDILQMSWQQVRDCWNQAVLDQYEHTVTPKRYALEYIKALRETGTKIAVATLTPAPLARFALEHHGFFPHLDGVFTPADVGGVGKECPDLFLKAASALETQVSDCVIFEDSLYAILPAVAEGFSVWGVDDPFQPDTKAIQAATERYIVSFEELLRQLPNPCR